MSLKVNALGLLDRARAILVRSRLGGRRATAPLIAYMYSKWPADGSNVGRVPEHTQQRWHLQNPAKTTVTSNPTAQPPRSVMAATIHPVEGAGVSVHDLDGTESPRVVPGTVEDQPTPAPTATAPAPDVVKEEPTDPASLTKVAPSKDDESEATKKAKFKKEQDEAVKNFKFRDLYRYASFLDMLLLAIGVLLTAINGALFPCMALIFGQAINSFMPFDQTAVNNAALLYLGLAVSLFVTDWLSYVLFHITAERQMKALREEALTHMLYLDVSWYDQHDALQLSSRLNGDTVKIKDGMGQKLGDSFRFTAQFITGYVIGLSKGWGMSLIMACVMPFMAMSLAFMLKTLRSRTEWAQKVYAEAGAVAEETLGSMRTIVSNNGEERAVQKYVEKATVAEEENIKLSRMTSCVMGMFFGSMWLMYAAGLWYGGYRVSQAKADPGSVFSAFFGILMGSMALAQISPNISAVATAKGAAAGLYAILATPSAIDASKDDGVKPATCSGQIEAKNLYFTYPSRPDAPILNGYSVKIEAGQTVAFVGASGGGKSTLVALLERFYDPNSGTLLLDGRDVKTLNVRWLRSQIGLVSQEPVLFATSIKENIAAFNSQLTQEQIEAAAKLANAHEFIIRQTDGYNTMVGEKGVSLSGGQKQRIAIARALVRNPKILVLDEATSALDNESERVVQAALNDLMDKTKMTTLVIAHRLSTVRRADKIVVLSGGRVVEQGPHDELMKVHEGIYRNLYTLQESPEGNHEDEEADDNGGGTPENAPMSARAQDSEHSDGRNSRTNSKDKVMPVLSGGGKKAYGNFSVGKAIGLTKPERGYFVIGCLAAAVCGASMPGSAILISSLVGDMNEKYYKFLMTQDHQFLDDLYTKVQMYGALYVGGAFLLMAATAIQHYAFKFMAEKLTTRLRHMHFEALCRQDIAYFDDAKHGTGALTAQLSTNATQVALLSGDAQGRVIQALFTLIAALTISFSLGSWKLSLVMLTVFPLLIFGQMLRMRHMKGGSGKDNLGDSGAHASQALSNIRTVVSLGLEKPLIAKYTELLAAPLQAGQREAHTNGLALGFSSFIIFAVYSLTFWYGGKLVKDQDIEFMQLMRTLMAIMMSAQGVGSAAAWLSDSDNATKAGSAIFELVEKPLTIDAFAKGGVELDRLEGRVEFQKILFRYPTRPEVTVLRNYNLTIEPGQTVAFCGPSGGGKSTCIGLLERFYDPVRGTVLLDGHDLKTLNLRWLRSQIGLVGQEPTLFIGTIADNIAYGLSRRPTQEEIEAAAKMANAHTFIAKFPGGYETQVGMKGEKLSGGQKQRIAIARAILKNPTILLLDEATSALDSESEKVVQEALDQVVALKRRTTIIIAHRLSTIRKADKICVVSGGKIAEQGTHQELLHRNGIYARLASHNKE